MNTKLTPIQGFNVMYEFLDIYFLQERSGDLATILGGMGFLSDGTTADTAMWGMWIESIDSICKKQNVDTCETLTDFQTFTAMMEFLDLYFGPQSYGDVEKLVRDIKLVISNKATDSVVWQNWLKAIRFVAKYKDKDSKNYLILFKK